MSLDDHKQALERIEHKTDKIILDLSDTREDFLKETGSIKGRVIALETQSTVMRWLSSVAIGIASAVAGFVALFK